MTTGRVLALVTNAADYQKVGYRTGLWLGELTHFQDVLEEAGYAVDLASPRGGYVPLDPERLSTLMLKMGGTGKRYADPAYMAVDRRDAVPFNLEKELGRSGAKVSTSRIPMTPNLVVDGSLVTGQNPSSAKGVGKEVVSLLAKAAKKERKQGGRKAPRS